MVLFADGFSAYVETAAQRFFRNHSRPAANIFMAA